MLPQNSLQTPSIVPWDYWYESEFFRLEQGMHVFICGPTGSGKTLLCRKIANLHQYVVVFGTKPADESLDEYIEDGYKRIDHWPPTRSEINRQDPNLQRYILWPKMKTIHDVIAHRELFDKCLTDVYVDGGWTVVMDESLWLADRAALNLGQRMNHMAFSARSNKVSLMFVAQRPANLPRICWSSCTQALLFHMGITDDITEMSTLGTYDRQEVRRALAALDGHQFLDLPCRGGWDWSISQVDKNSQAGVDFVP